MAAAFLPAPALAEIFLVGGTTGWNLSYPIGWPEGKTFKVGDSLVFDYPKGQFTVTEVDSETFRECNLQGNTIHEWTSGHDVVPLENPGRRWFFSSLANHCNLGLKLVVSVAGALAPAPAPEHHQPPNLAPSPVTVPPAPTPVSPAPTPEEAPPSPDKSSAGLNNRYKVGEAVARAAVVAGAVVAAVFV
ncbi:basic blue protein-like [Panicum miliaceum]|uniref:Basic blue protein-like n=1 Tax=Panicum miliaceum TaxID=4540 RepID=A0A3L6T8J8_PANMI|nr:basic blue protein-like [Panicum miliaceum]